jgi:hypothetical protein
MSDFSISAPEHLDPTHDLEPFDYGDSSLNIWIKTKAHQKDA